MKTRALSAFFVLMLSGVFSFAGTGGLSVHPNRIVLYGPDASSELLLINHTETIRHITLAYKEYRMETSGAFTEVTEPDSGLLKASDFIRLETTELYLHPGDSQIINFKVTKLPESPKDEYRSHLLIRNADYSDKQKSREDHSNMAFHIVPVFGTSIPVIWRPANKQQVNVEISNPIVNFDQGELKEIGFYLKRTGPHSSYGNISVWYINDAGKRTKVGLANGIAVYKPLKTRHFTLLLNYPGIDPEKGTIIVQYEYEKAGKVYTAHNKINLSNLKE